MGPPRADFSVLQLGHAYEQACGHTRTRSPLLAPGATLRPMAAFERFAWPARLRSRGIGHEDASTGVAGRFSAPARPHRAARAAAARRCHRVGTSLAEQADQDRRAVRRRRCRRPHGAHGRPAHERDARATGGDREQARRRRRGGDRHGGQGRTGRPHVAADVERERGQRRPVQHVAVRHGGRSRADLDARVFRHRGARRPPIRRIRRCAALLAFARAHPGKLNIGSINIGSTQNLVAELFKTSADIDAQIVPFNGTPALVQALRGRQVDVAVEILAPVMSQIKGDALRALAVIGEQALGGAARCADRTAKRRERSRRRRRGMRLQRRPGHRLRCSID